MKDIELYKMLKMLREELRTAEYEAEKEDEDLRFKMEDIEVEVNFIVSKKGAGKGKIKFLVYEAELGAEIASQTVHKVKFKMKPLGDVLVSDASEEPDDN